ncbi:hypothetical protein GCM10009636_26130 [Arthrobacter koreensis]|jgi:hypothetical protein|uniref:Uncharacterized protein n=1 Tax=Arthrobacter koreensis TaxID=199136 RepID=A0ABY6FVB9_9MICC|nr:hypothetical protein [Arthrobacter koreensis]MEB7449098.1 hypothetical protein [Arthrobacter koreensis]UYB36659.1 hypothetical protein N9A08_02965 [Arthrobacter koreensis]
MEHLGPHHADSADGTAAQGTARKKRSPLRLPAGILAAALAVAGVGSLAALLLEALRGEAVWPGFAAGAFYCLPLAFLMMAGLVIDSIVRRRRG